MKSGSRTTMREQNRVTIAKRDVVTRAVVSDQCILLTEICPLCQQPRTVLVPRPPVTADEIAMQAREPRFGAAAAMLLGICGALLAWLLVEIWPWIWSLLR